MAGCTTAPLHGIIDTCDTSKGGIKRIWMAPYAAGNATKNSAGNDQYEINVASVTDYKYFYVKKNTTSFTSTLTVDPANGVNFVTTVLSVVFNKMDRQKQAEMAALALNDLNVVVEDSNGNFWYLGFDNPVYATGGTGETGTNKTDGNKYTVELTCDSATYPYVLDSESAAKFKNIK